MANNEIISQADWEGIVKYGANAFGPDINQLIGEKQSYLDYLLAIIQVIKNKLSANEGIDLTQKYGNKKDILYQKIKEKNLEQTYVQITQFYYALRTFFTGETIEFVENIEGILRIVPQEDWIKNLSYNTDNAIVLLESILKQNINNYELVENSNIFSTFTRDIIKEGLFNDILEWADLQPEDMIRNVSSLKTYISSSGKPHILYQKKKKDTLVYAIYSNANHQKTLVYNAEQTYNLGWVQELLLAQLESTETVADQLALFTNLSTDDHPIKFILQDNYGKYRRQGNVRGTVEGDFQTALNQWIQSKNQNPQVISMLQAHQAILKIEGQLIKIKKALQKEKDIDKLVDKFYELFRSDKTNIDQKLRSRLKSQLMLLGKTIID